MTPQHLLTLFLEFVSRKSFHFTTYLIVAILALMQGVDVQAQILLGEDCSASIPSDGFEDGVACNLALNQIAANDILVPVDRNLKLNSLNVNLIIDENVTVTSVKVWIFYDEYGYPYMYPGYEHSSQTVTPADMTIVGNGPDKEFYEIFLELDPILLAGNEEYDTRY